MPETNPPPKNKDRKKRRKILKFVLWTTGILVLPVVLLFGAALLTVDQWIVPLAARYAGVEVIGSPGVKVSLLKREIVLTGLHVKCDAGSFETKTCGLKLEDVNVSGGKLRELRVSNVYADGLRGTLETANPVDSQKAADNKPISGEKVRDLSHKVWSGASKPVVRIADLSLTDAEISWQSGTSRNVLTLPSVTAESDDGRLTRPSVVCDADYRLDDGRCSVQFGARLRAAAPNGANSLIVSVAGKSPVTIKLPDAHFELPSSYILAQYEPDDDVIRFGGEWGKSDRWDLSPLDLSLDNGLFETFGTVSLVGEKVRLCIETSAQGSDLICGGRDIPGDVMFDAECKAVFDLATGGITLDSLSGYMTGPNGGRLDLSTSGIFEIVQHDDSSCTLVPHAARLTLRTGKPLDLTPFDAMLPFDAADRVLTADYFIELDPEKVCLQGGAGVEILDGKTMERVFDADAAFETEGVNRISSFHVSRCGMNFYDGDDRICRALFTGEYNIRAASLKGDVTYSPYRMVETFGTQELDKLCLFLNDSGLSLAEHTAKAELDFDLVDMSATLRKRSHLSHLGMSGSNGENLELDALGDATFRLDPEGGGWQMDCGLDLNAGIDFQAEVRASGGSDLVVSGKIDVFQFSDILAHQLERKFAPDSDELPVIRFINASGSAEFRYDMNDSRIVLSGLNATVDNGDGSVALAGDSEIVWTDGDFLRAPESLTLKTNLLPVSFLEPLLGNPDDFLLAGGVLTSELKLTSDADGKTFRGTGKLVGSDLAYLVDGDPYEVARLGANATFEFDPHAMLLSLSEINADIHDRQARQTLFAKGTGTVDLTAECRTRMHFSEVRCGPESLYLIGFGAERCFYFEDLDAVGAIDFDADRFFRELCWRGGLRINRMRLQSDTPDEFRFAELSGRIDGSLLWADKDLFGDTLIRLADAEGEEHFSGQYLYRRGEDALPKFISSSLDLPFAVSYFRYNHNPDPEAESNEIKLFDKTFELDLHGIYTRNHSMIFSAAGLLKIQEGDDPAIIVPHMKLSGDMFGIAAGEIHVVEDDFWPFDVDLNLNDIPLDKSFLAFLATDDNPEIPHELHGFVKSLKAAVHGEGFTTDALTRNLQADCVAELENISLRSTLRDSSLFLNILLLPLMSVPRLIDYVPGAMVRRVMRMATAGAVMDMISGESPIEFKRGDMTLSVRQGIVNLKEIALEGDTLENYNVKGTIDLAGDGIAEIETITRFAFFYWPIFLNGNILDPQVSFTKSISRFFEENAKRLLLLGAGGETPEAGKKEQEE